MMRTTSRRKTIDESMIDACIITSLIGAIVAPINGIWATFIIMGGALLAFFALIKVGWID